jgi:hypothetical protein
MIQLELGAISMKSLNNSSKRSNQARLNGAKSHGPKTPQGQHKARLASLRHGLYATEETLRATVSTEEFQKLREDYYEIWEPTNRQMVDKVEDLIRARWQLNRLYEVRQDYFHEIYDAVVITDRSKVTSAELAASEQGCPMDRLELRIRRYNMEISRLERDLIRLQQHFKSREASHKPLQTKPPATVPCYREPLRPDDSGGVPPTTSTPSAFGTQSPPETAPRS